MLCCGDQLCLIWHSLAGALVRRHPSPATVGSKQPYFTFDFITEDPQLHATNFDLACCRTLEYIPEVVSCYQKPKSPQCHCAQPPAQHYMSGELWTFFSSPVWFSKERSGPREARVQTFIFGRRQDMNCWPTMTHQRQRRMCARRCKRSYGLRREHA